MIRTQKWVFRGPNKALTKSGFKDQIGLKLGRTRREEKGKREKKRKKKKKERRSSQASQRYGTTWTSNALNGSPCLYSH